MGVHVFENKLLCPERSSQISNSVTRLWFHYSCFLYACLYIKCFRILQGERILKLAEMCRKLETEEEKVLPFYASSLTQEEQEDVEAAVAEPPAEPLASVRIGLQII